MTDKLILHLPLRIPTNKKGGFFSINLNEYRNAHFQVLNKAKITFKKMILDQLVKLPAFEQVELDYFLFPSSKRDMDTNNICSIADKFFSDALVESGKLEDDNYRFLVKSTFQCAGIDKNNPRVEVHIKGQTKEEDMQIQVNLNHDDFMEAIEAHVRKHFTIPEGTIPEIDITAGRGDKGYSAIVLFESSGKPADPLQKALKAAGSKMDRLDEDPMPTASKAEKPDPIPAAEVIAPKQAAEKAGTVEPLKEPTPAQDAAEGGTTDPEGEPEEKAAPIKPMPSGSPTQPLFDAPKAQPKAEEVSEEISPVKDTPKPTPLFNFGGTS